MGVKSPSVSVVMPTYNGEKYIESALDSIFAQTHPPHEVIVVDDGSTDTTERVVRCYRNRVNYIRQENRGAAGAYNTGIAAASGEFIAFLEHDDLWLPNKTAKQVAFFEGTPRSGLLFCPVVLLKEDIVSKTKSLELEDGEGEYSFADFFAQNRIINCSTVMIRRLVLEEVGLFREDLRLGFDYDLWLRIVSRHKVFSLGEALVKYRIHVSNLSSDANELIAAEGNLKAMRFWVGNPLAENAVGKGAVVERVVRLYRRVAWDYSRIGRRKEEMASLWEAVRMRPGSFEGWRYYLWRGLDPGFRVRLVWYVTRILKLIGLKS